MLSALTSEAKALRPMHRIRLALANCATWKTWCGVGTAEQAVTSIFLGEKEAPFTYPFACVLPAKPLVELSAFTELTMVPTAIEYLLMFQDETDTGVTLEDGRLAMDALTWALLPELQCLSQYANILEYRPMTMPLKEKEVQEKGRSSSRLVIMGGLELKVGFTLGGGWR